MNIMYFHCQVSLSKQQIADALLFHYNGKIMYGDSVEKVHTDMQNLNRERINLIITGLVFKRGAHWFTFTIDRTRFQEPIQQVAEFIDERVSENFKY